MNKKILAVVCLLGLLMVALAVRNFWAQPKPEQIELVDIVKVPKSGKPLLVEFPAEAAPAWRSEEEPPPLMLFSSDPFLEFPPEVNVAKALELFRTGLQTDIFKNVQFEVSDPLLLPNNTLRVALRSGVISELLWVLPVDEKGALADNKALYDWLIQQEQFSAEEKDSLEPTAEGVVGFIENKPFRAVAASSLKTWPQVACIHIDLTFVDTLFKNEINTPIYPLLKKAINPVLSKQRSPGKVSISYSTLNGDVPVQLRFVGEVLAEIASDSDVLERPLNDIWRGRRDLLYLENFQQLDKMLRIAANNVALFPENASAYFFLYRVHFLRKDMKPAIETLERACELDSGYVSAFRSLARTAYQQENYPLAVTYLKRASAISPENPFIKIDLADSLLMAGQRDGAAKIVSDLKQLSWSEIYYPMTAGFLEKLLARVAPGGKEPKGLEKTDKPVTHY